MSGAHHAPRRPLHHGAGPVHRLAAEAKVVAVVGFVVVAAVTPRRSVPSLVLDLVAVVVAAAWSGLGARHLLGRLATAVPFLGFAALLPVVAGGPRVDVAGVALSGPGLWAAWNVGAKATCGVLASAVLAGTTPVPELLEALRRLRLPAPLIAIAGFMVRYLDLLVEEWVRVRVAMVSRGYRGRWLWQAAPVASAAGGMFVRSFERGERIHAAMLSRGYTGVLPPTGARRPGAGDWLRVAPLPAVALAALAGGLL